MTSNCDEMKNWRDTHWLFMQLHAYRLADTWEPREEILELAKAMIEEYTGRPIRMRRCNRIKPRVVTLQQKLVRVLLNITIKEGSKNAAPFLDHLHKRIQPLVEHTTGQPVPPRPIFF